MPKPRLVFTVINDLNFDQRMIRICSSLSKAGYDVTLVGRRHLQSTDLKKRAFKQKRLHIRRSRGKLMYLSYWIKLFFYLMFKKADLICAIDLDTIVPVYFASLFKRTKKVYDAHELFTEMKEVVTRPREKRLWDRIERFAVPRFPLGYTIGSCYALEFQKKYGVNYAIVRNATVLENLKQPRRGEKYILYQGWVNEGRCFEELIPAMQWVDMPLIICGEGNFFEQARELTRRLGLERKIIFKGYIPPEALKQYTENAFIGITLFNGISKSNVLSMANRFFDYMHHLVPQVCMRFPEYEQVNREFEIAVLVGDPPSPESIAAAINRLITEPETHQRLSQNCRPARERYCWQHEEKTLIDFYHQILPVS
jgi:glycosyltransferase involved in cell wall biosynthesis